MSMKRTLLTAIAPLSLLALSGCISLLPEPPPPPRLYVLEAGQIERLPGARTDVVIAVASPQGDRTLLGSELIWRTGDTIAFVAQSEWSGRAQDALQAVLVETITRQGRVTAAARSGDARADYEVRWDVLDFEVVEGAGLTARFEADVKVMEAGSRRILASEIISTEAPVSGRSSSASAEALARAAREGSARIGVLVADTAAAQASAASINR